MTITFILGSLLLLPLSFAQNPPPPVPLPSVPLIDPSLSRSYYLSQSAPQLVPLLLKNAYVREYTRIDDNKWREIEKAMQGYGVRLSKLNRKIRTAPHRSAQQAEAIAEQEKAKDEFLPELAHILSDDQKNRILAVILAAKGHFEILDNAHLLKTLSIDEPTEQSLHTLKTAYQRRMVLLTEDRTRCLANPTLLTETLKRWKEILDEAYANEEIGPAARRAKTQKSKGNIASENPTKIGKDLVLSRFRVLQEEQFRRTDAMMGTYLGFSRNRFNALRNPGGKPFDFVKAAHSTASTQKSKKN